LHIPTQLANKAACGFYTKLGYKIIEKLIIKHYWRI
jgi:dTDP-4-amino-4,6-dideoxy-D-galactose acyltransferase